MSRPSVWERKWALLMRENITSRPPFERKEIQDYLLSAATGRIPYNPTLPIDDGSFINSFTLSYGEWKVVLSPKLAIGERLHCNDCGGSVVLGIDEDEAREEFDHWHSNCRKRLIEEKMMKQ